MTGVSALITCLVYFSVMAGTIDYTYDGNGRLVHVDYGEKEITYTYDKNGNILEKTVDSGDTCPVNFTGYSITGTLAVGSPITFTINAQNSCSTAQSYRFSYHPGYGTDRYNGTQWTLMGNSEYQTGNSCTVTFDTADRYIVVAWAVKDTADVDVTSVPTIGWSVDLAGSTCTTNIIGGSIVGNQIVNNPITFSVTGYNSCSNTLNYRFSMHPGYGTARYNGRQWTQMTDTEWISSNSATYTFTQRGKYIVVVWAVDNTSAYDQSTVPICGWSMDIK